jgi:Na+/H+ antiporter NhaD/arsenite permease-like protein
MDASRKPARRILYVSHNFTSGCKAPATLPGLTALLIFIATYVTLALGRFPGLRVDRTGAAIIGASLMIGFDVLTFEQAMAAIDHSTIVLLFGMMLVVANLRLSGFFRLAGAWAARHAHRPLTLLAAVITVSGFFSAFFVNDTMCIVLTPLVLEICLSLGMNPVPYLLAVAMSSNAGSVATITGNPQNMMVGSLSGIPYRDFTLALAPVALFGLLMTFAVIAFLYRREFKLSRRVELPYVRVRVNRALMAKSLIAAAAMIVLFFVGWPVAKVAIVAGGVLMITRRVKPEKVYKEIDWSLLALFCGLFIVVAGFEHTSVEDELVRVASRFGLNRVSVLSIAAAVVSNIVSNVPAVLLFRPIVPGLADPQLGWLVLAMASTLAGNFTVVASVANLIVVQRAKQQAPISFWDYFRAGAPLTVITLAAGTVWLDWIR